MKNSIEQVNHSTVAETKLEFDKLAGLIRLKCREPLDRNTDEWINISDTFRFRTYRTKIKRLFKCKLAEVVGARRARIAFKLLEAGSIEVSIRDGSKPQVFIFPIRGRPSDLLPSRVTNCVNLGNLAVF